MSSTAAVAATVILAGLAVFQIALVLGAPIGRFAWGGQHDVLPARLRVGSVVSVVLYGGFAAVLLTRAGLADLVPDSVARVGAWVLGGYFVLGVVLNGISRSRPERLTMTPVCLVLAVASGIVALGA